MPQQKAFGAKTTADRESAFVALSGKGEKLHMRITAPPAYDGKHFVKNGDEYIVEPCPKIMTEEYCPKCDAYYKLKKEQKAAAKSGDTEEEKRLDKEASQYRVKVTFYYPILNRAEERAQIYKAPLSIRLKIDQEAASGIDVTKFDYVVTRTEKPGADYYSLVRLDSSMTNPLTEREQVELEKCKTILNLLYETKDSEQELKKIVDEAEAAPAKSEPMDEKVNPDDIPF